MRPSQAVTYAAQPVILRETRRHGVLRIDP